LNAHPRSLDGRYFGPTEAQDIAGTALPVWTFPP
jgi:type IV secretory pathway protease TraF